MLLKVFVFNFKIIAKTQLVLFVSVLLAFTKIRKSILPCLLRLQSFYLFVLGEQLGQGSIVKISVANLTN